MDRDDNIHRAQARRFGQRILRQIRRIANYGSPRPAVRITFHAIDGGELLGHVDLDFATADTLHDIAKAQADTWDRETGVIGEPRDGEWDEQTFQRMHPELVNDLAEVAAQDREAIPSGEWSAAAVAQNDTDLWDQVNDIFDELDLVQVTKEVLDEPVASKLAVTIALDCFLGDRGDDYMDEDDV